MSAAPGPWTVVIERDGARYVTARGVRIAKLCGGTGLSGFPGARQPPHLAENLALIAAASRSGAACEALLATPFSVGSHDSGGGVTHRSSPKDDGARTGCRRCLAEAQARAALAKATGK